MLFKLRNAITAIILTLPLAGCLQPMYGGLAGGGLRSELAAIKVEPIYGRLGHYLANDLIFALNGTGSEVTPKYRLVVTVAQKLQTPLVDTITSRATSATVVLDASYQLIPVTGTEPVIKGIAFAAVSYDRTSQRFANVRAARDAEIRIARTLTEQIHTRIASALSDRN